MPEMFSQGSCSVNRDEFHSDLHSMTYYDFKSIAKDRQFLKAWDVSVYFDISFHTP